MATSRSPPTAAQPSCQKSLIRYLVQDVRPNPTHLRTLDKPAMSPTREHLWLCIGTRRAREHLPRPSQDHPLARAPPGSITDRHFFGVPVLARGTIMYPVSTLSILSHAYSSTMHSTRVRKLYLISIPYLPVISIPIIRWISIPGYHRGSGRVSRALMHAATIISWTASACLRLMAPGWRQHASAHVSGYTGRTATSVRVYSRHAD